MSEETFWKWVLHNLQLKQFSIRPLVEMALGHQRQQQRNSRAARRCNWLKELVDGLFPCSRHPVLLRERLVIALNTGTTASLISLIRELMQCSPRFNVLPSIRTLARVSHDVRRMFMRELRPERTATGIAAFFWIVFFGVFG